MSAGHGHRFVFVAGSHRSGTTLLARLLAAHREISGFSGTGAPADEGQHLQSVYPSDHEYGRPGRFGFAPEMHLTESSPLASDESARRRFAEWSPHWDLARPLLLEKSPPNLIETPFLQALFLDSMFVVVIRLPIPVSIPPAKWRGTRRYDRLLDHWLRCHALFEADREHLRRVHVLNYEQLVGDPAAVLEEIFAFLEVEPIPPSAPVDAGANEKYFRRWKELKRDPRMRAFLNLVGLKYEHRAPSPPRPCTENEEHGCCRTRSCGARGWCVPGRRGSRLAPVSPAHVGQITSLRESLRAFVGSGLWRPSSAAAI